MIDQVSAVQRRDVEEDTDRCFTHSTEQKSSSESSGMIVTEVRWSKCQSMSFTTEVLLRNTNS